MLPHCYWAPRPRQLSNYISWGGEDESVAYVHGAAPTGKLRTAGRTDAIANRLRDHATDRARGSIVPDPVGIGGD